METNDAQPDTRTTGAATARSDWLLVLIPAVLAGLVSAYLLTTSLLTAGRPIGCGAGSGCDEVLSSRWSRVAGVPVGLPALLLYATIAGAAWCGRGSSVAAGARVPSVLLWIAAGAVLSAAGWFVSLQWIDLGAFCPWCLAAHGLGAAAALAILTTELSQGRFRPLAFTGGVGASVLLALLQVFGPVSGPAVAVLDARQIELLGGRLAIDLNTAPRLGSPAAPQQVVVLFDYCCPHCRQTHAHLLEALHRFPDRFSVIPLPTPLNHECNPALDETDDRFRDACELARLALAVWRADAGRFAEFDRWLFDSPEPRSGAAARGFAEELIGAAALTAALDDEWIAARIRADVEAYAASGIDHIPVLLAPGRAGVSGRTADAAALEEVLRAKLGITLE